MKRVSLLVLLVLAVGIMGFAGAQAEGAAAEEDGVLTIDVIHGISKDRIPSERPSLFEKEILDRFNMRFEYEDIPGDQLVQKVNLLFASGEYFDYIDVINGGPRLSDYNNWGIDGHMIAMDEYIDQVPNFRALWTDDEWDYVMEDATAPDGHLYGLPTKNPRLSSQSWIYKKSAFDKWGIDFPGTTDELYRVLTQIKQNDPQFVGLPNRWGMWNVLGGLARTFHTSPGFFRDWDVGTDQIVYGPTTDKFRDMVAYASKLYQEGLIDPEFATASNQQWTERYAQGRAYLQYSYATRAAWAEGVEKSGVDWDWTKTYVNAYPDMPAVVPTEKPYWAWGPAITVEADEAKVDRLLEYLDWAATDEGELFHIYGVEGETFEYEDGEPVYMDHIYDAEENPDGTYMHEYGLGYLLRRPAHPIEAELSEYLRNGLDSGDFRTHKFIVWDTTEEEHRQLADLEVVIEQVRDEWVMAFVTGERDATSNAEWQAFYNELEKAGIEKATEIRQTVFQRTSYNMR
jgi:ABC-type glycerol-3-phosphate transport system substrate-binding protein